MESFENFQYDSASSYGGMSIVDDTSSVYTSTTAQERVPVDLESLSISGSASTGATHAHIHHAIDPSVEEDIDAVLDDLKEEREIDLPPHACR
jgi:regulator of nonsense transcripts 1